MTVLFVTSIELVFSLYRVCKTYRSGKCNVWASEGVSTHVRSLNYVKAVSEPLSLSSLKVAPQASEQKNKKVLSLASFKLSGWPTWFSWFHRMIYFPNNLRLKLWQWYWGKKWVIYCQIRSLIRSSNLSKSGVVKRREYGLYVINDGDP